MQTDVNPGELMYQWATDLFPINRSLTGPGVRQTLAYLGNLLPGLVVHEVPSGTLAFDWTVPDEWTIRDAYIKDESGERIVDFQRQNLHVVGYSEPVNRVMALDELDQYLHSLPEQPNAVPYITSYYARRWGFCLSHAQREKLKPGQYHVVIDSELNPGVLNYGELLLAGDSKKEIFLSTYICHPSMANNELSGPVVASALAQWLTTLEKRRYSYRFVFIPETIGSIVYLSKHMNYLKKWVVGGFNVTCVGDDRDYSYLPSRNGNTISDVVSKHVLKHIYPSYKSYHWTDRGSDERQYCSPGIDLPIASIMRTMYGKYEEYHTSFDDLLRVVTPEGLQGGYNALKFAIKALEGNYYSKVNVFCEPQLGKRGLYPKLSTISTADEVRVMSDLITWSDGTKSILDIAEISNVPIWDLFAIIKKLCDHQLLSLHDEPVSF